MKNFFLLISLSISCFCHSQQDCKSVLVNYRNSIDTTHRPVYSFVDSMPGIASNRCISEFFWENKPHIDSSNCFPTYIYYGFVVEPDCSISNIMFCPTLMFCDPDTDISLVENKYIQELTSSLQQITTTPGMHQDGKRVAVSVIGRIHFDPAW